MSSVTDAYVVLGLIDPDYFLGGRMKLDKVAAETAVQEVANPLGVAFSTLRMRFTVLLAII